MRSYSDAEVAEAVRQSRSWRGVLRVLGLSATSGSAIRSVRNQADRLNLDHSHFTGQRTWTHEQLAAAISRATTWEEVAETLGLFGSTGTTTVRGHALRLGIDTGHLAAFESASRSPADMTPRRANLPRAGSLMAAAWFELCGLAVSWPMEPCRYDLLVWRDGRAERVQVKTTTVKMGKSWTVWLSTTSGGRAPYDPDEIDEFFVIDGDLNHYLIPVAAVGGLMVIHLSAYQGYRLRSMNAGDTHPRAAGAGRPDRTQ
jgi:hypothetical protein